MSTDGIHVGRSDLEELSSEKLLRYDWPFFCLLPEKPLDFSGIAIGTALLALCASFPGFRFCSIP